MLFLGLLCTLTACGQIPEEENSPSSFGPASEEAEPSFLIVESKTESPASSAASPEESRNLLPEKEEHISGELLYAAETVLGVREAQGKTYEVHFKEPLREEEIFYGSRVEVTYEEGERKGEEIWAKKVELFPGEAQAAAELLLSAMTLEEKVAQLFFVRCPKQMGEEEAAAWQFGGYLLFDRDFREETPESLEEKLRGYQAASKIPLLIGVDEEGGEVVRVSDKPAFCEEAYWSPRQLYGEGDMDLLLTIEEDKLRLLSSLDITVNFAPVCDISCSPDDFMYSRSLGESADVTSEFVRRMVRLYGENEMGCVLKHFPGYGNNADTHTGIAQDQRPFSEFREKDFLPFSAGIEEGAGCVLVSHNIVSCKDSQRPASLSEEWHRVLREELGFSGCILTDDLSMGAISDFCDNESAAVEAVKAGNDMLCCTDYSVQLPAVVEAVKAGEIPESRIEESVKRVLIWKFQLGLLS